LINLYVTGSKRIRHRMSTTPFPAKIRLSRFNPIFPFPRGRSFCCSGRSCNGSPSRFLSPLFVSATPGPHHCWSPLPRFIRKLSSALFSECALRAAWPPFLLFLESGSSFCDDYATECPIHSTFSPPETPAQKRSIPPSLFLRVRAGTWAASLSFL